MGCNQAAQEVAVFSWVAGHEGRAEAGRECRLWFLAQALFGAGYFGGEAGEEMIHRLAWREFGNGR